MIYQCIKVRNHEKLQAPTQASCCSLCASALPARLPGLSKHRTKHDRFRGRGSDSSHGRALLRAAAHAGFEQAEIRLLFRSESACVAQELLHGLAQSSKRVRPQLAEGHRLFDRSRIGHRLQDDYSVPPRVMLTLRVFWRRSILFLPGSMPFFGTVWWASARTLPFFNRRVVIVSTRAAIWQLRSTLTWG